MAPILEQVSTSFETPPSAAPQAEVDFLAIKYLPHAEERCEAWRLEGRRRESGVYLRRRLT
jgi:hypothetical protein